MNIIIVHFNYNEFKYFDVSELNFIYDIKNIEQICCVSKNTEYFITNLVNNNYDKKIFVIGKDINNSNVTIINSESLSTNNNVYTRSFLINKLHNIIPGGCHTYSRGIDQFPINSPILLISGKDAYTKDINNIEYLDYCMGCRSIILGHSNDCVTESVFNACKLGNNLSMVSLSELRASELLKSIIPYADMIKFAKNGSNVTTGAIKLSRAYTNKLHVIICEDHPFFSFDDWFIGTTIINKGTLHERSKCPFLKISDTLKFKYNDINSLEKLFIMYENQIACLIMEPITNQEPIMYDDGLNFLQKVRELCNKNKCVLIFDEMITGFRMNYGAVSELYNVTPDLGTFGKAIANGYSLAFLCGKKEIMNLGGILELGKERTFLLSSTHGGETTSLEAMIKTIQIIKEKNVIGHINKYGSSLISKFNELSKKYNLINDIYMMGHPTRPEIRTTNINLRTLFLQEMMKHKVIFSYVSPTYSHGEKEMNITLNAIEKSFIVCKCAIIENIEKYLICEYHIKPVFRKYN